MTSPDSEAVLSGSLLDPTLGHLERVEKSVKMLSVALHLEMAELALSAQDQDPGNKATLQAIGSAATRIANLATEIAENTSQQRIAIEGEAVVATVPPHLTDQIPTELQASLPIVDIVTQVSTPRLVHEAELAEVPLAELYRSIVPIEQIPIMELPEGASAVTIEIYDDRVLLNGESIKLSGDRLFMFNSLMTQRNQLVTNKEIRAKGFKGDAAAFHGALSTLITQLNRAAEKAGTLAVKKTGQRADVKYGVNPVLQFIDKRTDSSAPLPTSVKKN